MRFSKIFPLMFCSALAMGWSGCAHSHGEHDDEHGDEHAGHDGHDHSGDITIDPAMAERLGVKFEKVEPGDFSRVIHATGILERPAGDVAEAPAPVAGTVTPAPGLSAGSRVERGQVMATIATDQVSGGDTEAAARAEAAAAERELSRIEGLYADRLVTAAEYSAAKAAAERARAALSKGGAGRKVLAPISGTVLSVDAARGSYVGAGQAVATVVADGALTLRVDVPARKYKEMQSVTDARFSTDGGEAVTVASLGGRRLPSSTSGAGYVSAYFSVPSGAGIPAGSAADVWLLGEPRQGVLSVPLSALSEQQGRYYVFEAIHPHEGVYRKVPVTIGATDGSRAEITSGLRPGRMVVTRGATAVRLAEMQSVLPEGHSHNH